MAALFNTLRTNEDIKEIVEPRETIEQKAKEVASMIKSSKHFIIFTGAGISTSAGIPDFRGPEGIWTLQARGIVKQRPTALSTIPTKTHMAIVKLVESGICKYVVSQNTDGLHRRSGIHPSKLSELHGNSNLERCENCNREYLRDFSTRAPPGRKHVTGRKCYRCGGRLLDTIIHFGEPLPKRALQLAFEHSDKADLCLALGSSLTVTPASEVCANVIRNGQKLVIVNLQRTPLDSIASIVIHGKTDEVMELIMKNLNLEIPKFYLTRRVLVGVTGSRKLLVRGIDVDGTPATILKRVTIGEEYVIEKEPFELPLRKLSTGDVNIRLEFMGHYNEPPLTIQHRIPERHVYVLKYDPEISEWKIL